MAYFLSNSSYHEKYHAQKFLEYIPLDLLLNPLGTRDSNPEPCFFAPPHAMGKVVYTLKTPYRDGTTQVPFEPIDFVARLAALVPKPRINLTRYHGVLAPNHRCRGLVTPARRGKGIKSIANAEVRTPAERHAARACTALSGMTWAQRLKRVFSIDMPQGTLS